MSPLSSLPALDYLSMEVLAGIMVYTYVDGAVIGIDEARAATERGSEVIDRPHPTLVRLQRVAEVSREARLFFAEDPANARITSAICVRCLSDG